MSISLETLLRKANTKLDVKGMDKDVSDKVRAVIKKMHAEGIYVCVAQGYRSTADQNNLYAIGRTVDVHKPVVTNARGGQSNHNYGVAVDLCQYDKTIDKIKWEVSTPSYKKIVSAMKAEGFKWGGDWASFRDYPHFELYDAVRGEKKPADKKDLKKAVTKPKPKPKAVTDNKAIVPYPGKPLYKGAKGMKKVDIQRVQRAVGASVTGKYDSGTDKAVTAYQKRKGLEADGVVGKDTWNTLF